MLQKDSESNSKANRSSQIRRWVFTYNNYELSMCDKHKVDFEKISIKGLFGEEIGDSGTPHLQGYIEFKNGRSARGVQDLLPKAHWSRALGDAASNWKYCNKGEKVRSWGNWSEEITAPVVIIDPLKGFTLHDWQQEIVEICLSQPDQRTIHWYWEHSGNVGKTTFAKHMCLNHNSLYINGKGSGVKFAIAAMKIKPVIVIMGIPRTCKEFTSYATLEEVKDGIFFSDKYESGMCLFNSPHIIVFANFPPDRSKLSEDRWKVTEIGKGNVKYDF